MSEPTLIHSTIRDKTGKSSVKKLKSKGLIPAVVYGHNFTALPISIDLSEINNIFKPGLHKSGDYQLFNLLIDGKSDNDKTTVMIKDIQKHPLTERIVHIDFFAVKMDEKVIANVQVRLTGKPQGVKLGGILRQILREIEVKSLPADIPPHFEIDVSELQIGESLHVKDLKIPENIQIQIAPDAPVVAVLAPIVQDEGKPEEAAAEIEEQADAAQTSAQKETKEKE
jgi:large subunit ribosomal protein L25